MHKLTLLDADAPNSGGGMNQVSDEDKKAVDQLREQYNGMRAEMAKIIIGQDKVVEQESSQVQEKKLLMKISLCC